VHLQEEAFARFVDRKVNVRSSDPTIDNASTRYEVANAGSCSSVSSSSIHQSTGMRNQASDGNPRSLHKMTSTPGITINGGMK
jgi:hypothetical protein